MKVSMKESNVASLRRVFITSAFGVCLLVTNFNAHANGVGAGTISSQGGATGETANISGEPPPPTGIVPYTPVPDTGAGDQASGIATLPPSSRPKPAIKKKTAPKISS